VAIATPHHSHAWIAVAAANAGKDIFLEKPLTHTVTEGRAVVEAVRRNKRILQVGTHRRAGAQNRLGCELIRNQRIGQLKTVRVQGRPGLTLEAAPKETAEPVPEGFAWDLWVGPAPFVDYAAAGVHTKRRWNQYSDYSTGEITMTDCHIIDCALWACSPFLKGPVEIEGGMDPEPNISYRVTFHYANGITFICEGVKDGQPASPGVRFEGTEGWVHIDTLRYSMKANPESLKTTVIGPNEVHLPELKHTPPEWRPICEDFIQAVKARRDPICPVEGGHQMTTISNLTWLVATRLKRKLKWDDQKEEFVGDEAANKLLHYAYRKPFSL